MSSASSFLSKLKSLDILEAARQAVSENLDYMTEMNADQLSRGLLSDGSPIQPDYRPLTIRLKRGKPGLAGVTSHVTTYSTGNHYNKMYTRLGSGVAIAFGSEAAVSDKLHEKYSTGRGQLYGLTEASKRELVETRLRPRFLSIITSRLK